jgi:hypothetical protein
MKPGTRAGGEAHQDAGRSRFRLSFTVAVLQLAVAVAGVGVALLVTGQSRGTPQGGQRSTNAGSQTANTAGPSSSLQPTERTSTTRESGESRSATTPSDRPAPIHLDRSTISSSVYGARWPAGFAGYTVALASDVIRSDAVGAVAKANTAGLLHVGFLRSDHYASLRPGYWFVFSGIYKTAEEARPEVSAAVDAGFSDAYVRHVAE